MIEATITAAMATWGLLKSSFRYEKKNQDDIASTKPIKPFLEPLAITNLADKSIRTIIATLTNRRLAVRKRYNNNIAA